jgi:dephospho-CoA kinase
VTYKLKSSIQLLDPENRMHDLNCPILGLTGGIATGKSTVAKIFVDKGFSLISADNLVKKVYQKKQIINFIKENWPDVFENNEINFKLLRTIAFSNIKNRTKIEELIYSHLKDQFLKEFNTFKNPELVVYDVPLLFEKNLTKLIDFNVVVYSSVRKQIERLIIRDGVTEAEASLALSNQIDIDKKKDMCDYLIPNIDTLEELTKEVELFIDDSLTK